jgi:hypothetical protein
MNASYNTTSDPIATTQITNSNGHHIVTELFPRQDAADDGTAALADANWAELVSDHTITYLNLLPHCLFVFGFVFGC